MTITRRVFLATGAAMTAVAVGQLKRQAPAIAQSRSRVLNLYSARHYDTDDDLYKSFTDKTGISVNLVEAEADQLIQRIRSEGRNSPADVILTVDAGRLWRAQQAGILQPVNSRVLNTAIPSSFRDAQGNWFGLSKRARVIAYNKDKVNPAQLRTYEALADARWRGKLLTRSSNHVYNQSLVGSILAARGAQATEQWARGIVANLARPPQGGDTDQLKALAAGVGDIALSNTYYLVRLMKSNKPEDKAVADKIRVVFPNQGDRGTHVNISGGAVVKTSRNKAGAIAFLEHLVSPEAQRIFAMGNNEYPIVASAAVDATVKSLGNFKEDKLNASVYGRNNAEALRIMDRAGWK